MQELHSKNWVVICVSGPGQNNRQRSWDIGFARDSKVLHVCGGVEDEGLGEIVGRSGSVMMAGLLMQSDGELSVAARRKEAVDGRGQLATQVCAATAKRRNGESTVYFSGLESAENGLQCSDENSTLGASPVLLGFSQRSADR
jgi:hypothetical protein